MTAIVKEALLDHFGSLKAAAIEMGIDQGQLTRDLESGAFKFTRLERIDPVGKALVCMRLAEAFGSPESAAVKARRLLRTVRRHVEELEELVS